ncbi:TPA: hypothetical protein ACNCEW_003490 [Escherichia coli]|uniref:hypothetical protein n=1 Tax=Escherichia coli TaxID=562 RepID=UPI0006DB11B5|nr:hypothetical protein [Escherichia coli]EER8911877.1 hypothetical protein [Escherichia coli]EFK3946333.1 hypothetical protein [Escherichia coli]EFU9701178.1 hypothetical protein [Escherichia coli]EIO5812481.1 hypothetical protein [Escherichia coli]EIS9360422.1 hypothetical protein [Escherichia coli]
MSSEHVRKGVTNAKFNEEQSNILFIEIGILSILIGLMSKSWWAFGGSFLGLIFSLRIKFLAIPLMIVFSLVWGAIGYSIGALFESTAASIVLGIIAFLSGLGTHLAAVQWANDIAE